MKLRILILFFIPCVLYAQQDTSAAIQALKNKIHTTENGEKLKWMDSLAYTVLFKAELGFDSIVNQTIAYAIELDSLNLAAEHVTNYINYKNNFLGKSSEGEALFKKYYPLFKGKIKGKHEANLFIDGGDSQDFSGNKDKAIEFYDKAIAIGEENNLERTVAIATFYKGYVLSDTGDFAAASENFQKASKIFTKLKDTMRMVGIKNSLSILYSQNAFYEEAKKERDEGIALAKLTNKNNILVSFYYNAATDAKKQGNLEDLIKYLHVGYETSMKSDRIPFYEPIFFSGLANAYIKTDSLEKANYYLNELEKREDYISGSNEENYIEVQKNMAFAKKEYSEAIRLGLQHLTLEEESHSWEDIKNAEAFLAKTYETTGNTNEAYAHYKIASRITDSINGIRNVKALTYYQTLYETEKRDARIQSQQSSITLLNAKNRLKNQWLIFGGLGLLAVFGVVLLFRSRNNAKEREKRQEHFSQELIKTQEEERTRVARELHDSVGQKLMLLTKKTKTFGDDTMGLLADDTLEELRSISRGLYPANLEQLGVTKAIESMINEVDANTNIFFTNEIDNIDNILSKEASLHLYRIIQEAINNMVKHASAKAASVTIERKDARIEALITDNGKGFQFSEKIKTTNSLGMKTLLERAKILHSKLDIISEPNKGTKISLSIPTV